MERMPRQRTVQCASAGGLHRMAYAEWGLADNPRVLICAHGLTRTGRDFDALAADLAAHYRVVCPDVAGRGDSDWLGNAAEYALPTYVADMVTLIARLDVAGVHWLGTSMGGLIGMALASLAGTPVTRLVLNDVGPVLPAAALDRIASYVGAAPAFDTIEAAERYVRTVSVTFGPHSDAQWRGLAESAVRRGPDGRWRMAYDPAIAKAFQSEQPRSDVDLWPLYDAVRCPTLVIRGELSDLLTRETATAMAQRGPRAAIAEVRGVGHAPTFLHGDQIALAREFLLG